ncbi:Zinc finger CXXC-type [Trinorchestia longiramus]|nr:Zinc finger CXXC-type [Trinorchestia longiramus]
MESATSSTSVAPVSLLTEALTGPSASAVSYTSVFPNIQNVSLLNSSLVLTALQGAHGNPSAITKVPYDISNLASLSSAEIATLQASMKGYKFPSVGFDYRPLQSDGTASKNGDHSSSSNYDNKQSSKSSHKNGRSPLRSAHHSDISSNIWKEYEQAYPKASSTVSTPAPTVSVPSSSRDSSDSAVKLSVSATNHFYKTNDLLALDHYNALARSNPTPFPHYNPYLPEYLGLVNPALGINADSAADYLRSPEVQQHLLQKLTLQHMEATNAVEKAKNYPKSQKSKSPTTSTPAKINPVSKPSNKDCSSDAQLPPVADSAASARVDLSNKLASRDNISAAIRYIFEKGDKMNNALVSLVSDDRVVVDAHLLLLVATSELIKSIFESDDIRHLEKPMIILEGTKGTDLKALVKGLYTGRLPEDSNVTGVRAAAQMLGLRKLDEYFQSLLEDLTRNSSSRHKSDSGCPPMSQKVSPSVALPASFPKKSSESPSSVHDALNQSDGFSSSINNSLPLASSPEQSESKGTKRKENDPLFSSKGKQAKLDIGTTLFSESSPLNLSKSSSSDNEGNKSDHNTSISQQALPSAPLNVELSKNPSHSIANYDLNTLLTACSFLSPNNFLDLFSANAANPTNSRALIGSGSSNAFNLPVSLPSCTPSTSKLKSSSSNSQSKGSKSSKSGKNNRGYDVSELKNNDMKILPLEDQQNILQALTQLELQKTFSRSLDPASAAATAAAAAAAGWSLFGASSSFGSGATDLSNSMQSQCKDTSGALNLSFDTREQVKSSEKKESHRIESAGDSFSVGPSVWSGISNNLTSPPAFSLASYSPTAPPCTSTAGPSTSADAEQANGILNSFLMNSSSSITAGLQDNTFNSGKPKTPDGQALTVPSAVAPSVPGPSGSPVEEGMDDIIEVLSEDNGALLSYSGDAAKLLYSAANNRRRSKRCNLCEGCLTSEDCGLCRYCLDKAKYGGPNKLKQVCTKKRCVHELKEKTRYRCGQCNPCLTTTDCGECNSCLNNKNSVLTGAKKQHCEMQVCDVIQMEEFKLSRNANCNTISQFSAEFARSEAHSTALIAAAAAAAGSSNCPSPDDILLGANRKPKKKIKQKLGKDGKPMNAKPGRMKYQCNLCYGCSTDMCCKYCIYCVDMPKYGGGGRFRQKCLRRLCISHPRLLSNKMPSGTDADCPSQDALEAILEPYKLNMEAANVAKTSVINFLRLHSKREGGNLEKQITKVLEVLDLLAKKLPEDVAGCEMDMKEERVETPDQGDYLNDHYRRSASASGSTPEPSDSIGASCASRSLAYFDKNRQVPELRPISGASSTVAEYSSDASTSLAPTGVASVFSSLPESYLSSTAATTGGSLAESDLASIATLQQQFQLRQIERLVLQQQQQQQHLEPEKNTAAEMGVSTTSEITGEESQGETDVDIEKIESDPIEVATDLSSKTATEPKVDVANTALPIEIVEASSDEPANLVDEDNLEDEPELLDQATTASPEITVIADEELKVNNSAKIIENQPVPSKDVNFDDEKVITAPITRGSSRTQRTTDSRGRASRSSSDNSSSPPQTRKRLRDLPARRGKRRRATRYSAGYCDDSENDELVDDRGLVSNHNSDGEEELLKVGSDEEEEEENARTADIQAAVQDVLDHQLAEEEIKRTSKERTELVQTIDIAEGEQSVLIDDDGKPAVKSDQRTSSNHTKESIITNDANGNTDISFNLRKYTKDDATKEYMNGPYQALNKKQSPPNKPDLADNKRVNSVNKPNDPPPVPKLKLRLNNRAMSVEKIAPESSLAAENCLHSSLQLGINWHQQVYNSEFILNYSTR